MRVVRWIAIILICGAFAWTLTVGERGGPELGRPAPPIEVMTLADTSFSLKAQEGRVVVLDFWATWCPPCRKSLPALQQLHERYRGDDRVVIASVNTDKGANRAIPLRRWMSQRKFDFPVLLEPAGQPISAAYAVRSIPTMVVIGPEGGVRAVKVGLPAGSVDAIAEAVDAEIRAALAGGES